MGDFNDPELCHKMHEPFPTVEAANAAIDAFWDEAYELRKKHKIADVLLVIAVSARREDGKVGESLMCGMIGDSFREESLAAYAFGNAAERRQSRLEEIVRSASSFKKPKSK